MTASDVPGGPDSRDGVTPARFIAHQGAQMTVRSDPSVTALSNPYASRCQYVRTEDAAGTDGLQCRRWTRTSYAFPLLRHPVWLCYVHQPDHWT